MQKGQLILNNFHTALSALLCFYSVTPKHIRISLFGSVVNEVKKFFL